ncbi:Ig-like domain-containing protein [Streptomyces sp. LS1784]|uniref:Ig-like domain-containing protein n=1 Tax=Streptomyces sp. LS1784 TaxID=2851533 RepID=UPI001CCA9199|nr:Ig-like domain-containing protein [Streptomyces sp. LS1784]
MSGNTGNARLWTDADVWIASSLTTANPIDANTPFGAGWTMVGLLDGDDGMPESRDEDTSDYYAWGGILVRSSRKNFKLTKKFGVLEDNPVTRSLLWPGSTATQIVVPKPVPTKIAFETRDSATGLTVRRITRNYAIITLDGDQDENETDLMKSTFAAVIYPDGGRVLFDKQTSQAVTSLAVAPATKTLTVGGIGALTATATLADASTRDVSADPYLSWTTSAPAKAGVQYGYVTGVAVGAATITATYQGLTASCAVTVS